MQFQKPNKPSSNNSSPKGKYAIFEDPLQILLLILGKWKWILLTTIATTAIAAIYLFYATPIYQAKARIEIFQESRLINKTANVYERMERSAQRHMLLMGSRQVRQKSTNQLRSEWEDKIDELTLPIDFEIVKASRGSMIDISATATDSEYAKKYLEQIIEAYRILREEELSDVNEYALVGLRSEEQLVRKELEDAKIDLHAFVEENEVFLSQEREDMDSVFINQLLTRLKTIRLERIMLENQYEDIIDADLATIKEALDLSRGIRAPSNQNIDVSSAPSSTQQNSGLILPGMALAAEAGSTDALVDWEQQEETLSILQNRYNDNLVVFKPTHPEMERLKAEIASLENNLKKKAEIALRRFQARFTALKMQEQGIESVVSTWEREQPLSIERKNEFLALETKATHLQRKYDAVYKRLLDSTGTNDSLSMRIIQAPRGSIVPVSPKTSKALLAGLMAGLAISIGCILLLEILRPELLDIEYIESHHDISCLVTIPDWRKIIDIGDFNPAKDAFVVQKDKNQVASETYRALRYRLNSIFGEERPVSIALTSFKRNDGKTFNASNLAVPYAWDDKRVLLVDGDIRRASLTNTLLGKRVPKGWTTWLHDNDTDLKQLITKVGETGVDLLPAGIFDDSIPDRLKRNVTRKLIDQLNKDYDIIIFDTAPSTMVVETNEICKAVDGAVIMADERTTQVQLNSVLRSLKDINVIGFCVNNVQPKEKTDYAYYGYANGYNEANPTLNNA